MGKRSAGRRTMEQERLPANPGDTGTHSLTKRIRRVSVKGRRVGVAFEKKIIKRLGLWWADDPLSLYRSHGSGGRSSLISADSGLYSGDVMPVKDSAQPWPFSIELKKSETFTMESVLLSRKSLFYKFWKQTTRDARRTQKIPLLICGKNHREPLVYFYARHFDVLIPPALHPPCLFLYPGGTSQHGVAVMPMRVFVESATRSYIMEYIGATSD